jgi:hypothetical protein
MVADGRMSRVNRFVAENRVCGGAATQTRVTAPPTLMPRGISKHGQTQIAEGQKT